MQNSDTPETRLHQHQVRGDLYLAGDLLMKVCEVLRGEIINKLHDGH